MERIRFLCYKAILNHAYNGISVTLLSFWYASAAALHLNATKTTWNSSYLQESEQMQQERSAESVLQLVTETEQGIPAIILCVGMQIFFFTLLSQLCQFYLIRKWKITLKIKENPVIFIYTLFFLTAHTTHNPILVLLHAGLCSFFWTLVWPSGFDIIHNRNQSNTFSSLCGM